MPHKGEILVVEDEEHIVDVVRMYLENEGYTVVHAPTGEEALRAAEQRPPTLVILDLALPGIDGIEVCKKLRAKSFVPVVMLTARDAEIDRVVGLEIGADDYVTKPFSPRELVARVKAILRRVEPAAPLGTPLAAGGVTRSGRSVERRQQQASPCLSPLRSSICFCTSSRTEGSCSPGRRFWPEYGVTTTSEESGPSTPM